MNEHMMNLAYTGLTTGFIVGISTAFLGYGLNKSFKLLKMR